MKMFGKGYKRRGRILRMYGEGYKKRRFYEEMGDEVEGVYKLATPDVALDDAILDVSYTEDGFIIYSAKEIQELKRRRRGGLRDKVHFVRVKLDGDCYYAVYENDGQVFFGEGDDLGDIYLDKVDYYTNFVVDGKPVSVNEVVFSNDNDAILDWKADYDWEVIIDEFKLDTRGQRPWATFIGFILCEDI